MAYRGKAGRRSSSNSKGTHSVEVCVRIRPLGAGIGDHTHSHGDGAAVAVREDGAVARAQSWRVHHAVQRQRAAGRHVQRGEIPAAKDRLQGRR